MTLRLRLIVLLSVLFVCIFAGAAVALLSNTRSNVGAESRAALGLVMALAADAPLAQSQLAAIARTRHLRLESAPGGDAAPAWFARIVSPHNLASPVLLHVAGRSAPDDAVRVRAAPEDEIGEAWEDLADSTGFALLLLIALCLSTGLIVRRELAPLEALGAALREVERGALDTRMPPATLPEIARLCRGFNRMAASLAEAQRTNRELTRRLIGMQESERRVLARELHDEFGQHLTAIRADAAALLAPNATLATARLSGRAIEHTGATMMRLLRPMLERLRPEVLDALGLCAALEDLVAGFRVRNCEVVVTLDLAHVVDVEEERAIALYRVAQEALTNISRHARARRVSVSLAARNGLFLQVADDGRGMPTAPAQQGFGLIGMRERVESCGGRFEVAAGIDGRGTAVRASFTAEAR